MYVSLADSRAKGFKDPGDARDPSMPMSALLHDNPDLCLPLGEIPGVIIGLSSVSQGST